MAIELLETNTDAEGKTVESIRIGHDGLAVIKFTDGTGLVLQGTYEDDYGSLEGVLIVNPKLSALEEKGLGLISEDEYRKRKRHERKLRDQQALLHERRLYEQLKRKFEL